MTSIVSCLLDLVVMEATYTTHYVVRLVDHSSNKGHRYTTLVGVGVVRLVARILTIVTFSSNKGHRYTTLVGDGVVRLVARVLAIVTFSSNKTHPHWYGLELLDWLIGYSP